MGVIISDYHATVMSEHKKLLSNDELAPHHPCRARTLDLRAVITVTVEDTSSDPTHASGVCGYATCSPIGKPGANEFIVRTYAGGVMGCSAQDFGFYFHLTGKKE